MDNTITALRILYVALGGTAADVKDIVTIPEMIKAISTVVSGGGSGSGLPEVTSDDNGKVLTVVEGEWSAAGSVAKCG